VTQILEKYLSRTYALAEQGIINFKNAKATKFANRQNFGDSALNWCVDQWRAGAKPRLRPGE
jgi:hypothetical protein